MEHIVNNGLLYEQLNDALKLDKEITSAAV